MSFYHDILHNDVRGFNCNVNSLQEKSQMCRTLLPKKN